MAYDRYEIEYHLTPEGWVSGSETDQNSYRKVEAPANRVETWLHKRQSSGWTWTRIWIHPAMTEARRSLLRRSFKPPGKDFP